MHVAQGKFAWFHATERFLEKLLHLCRLHIAKDKNHAVFAGNVAIAEFEQIFLREPLNGLHRTICAQGKRMSRKERLPHDVARNGRQLLLLLLDRGDLNFFFSRDRFFRHGRVEQHIRKQLNA